MNWLHCAMVVMKMTMTLILQRFRLTVVLGSRIKRHVQVTMRPEFDMPMGSASKFNNFKPFRSAATFVKWSD
jgi:hypothetical protein